jgi:hypothetical protein
LLLDAICSTPFARRHLLDAGHLLHSHLLDAICSTPVIHSQCLEFDTQDTALTVDRVVALFHALDSQQNPVWMPLDKLGWKPNMRHLNLIRPLLPLTKTEKRSGAALARCRPSAFANLPLSIATSWNARLKHH